MSAFLLTSPASEPLTLDEAKQFLRVEHDDDDALIASLIVVGAAASIALLGGGVGGMWANVASAVSAAM